MFILAFDYLLDINSADLHLQGMCTMHADEQLTEAEISKSYKVKQMFRSVVKSTQSS